MSRFEYVVIAGQIGNNGGVGEFKRDADGNPITHLLTVHHSATIGKEDDSPVLTASAFTAHHNGMMPYHFLIPYDKDDPNIYVTQWLYQYTWHNSNKSANMDAVAVCLVGNFEVQEPLENQLLKLKQLCDDLYGNWFTSNGWVQFDRWQNPRNNQLIREHQGVAIKPLNYHNECAMPGYGTACCGKNLKPFVVEYRDKQGKVSWGQVEEPTPPATNWEAKYKEAQKIIKAKDKKLATGREIADQMAKRVSNIQKDIKTLKGALQP